MKRNKTIIIASVCLAALIAVIAPRVAAACGSYAPPTDKQLVSRVASLDGYYIARGDSKHLATLWTNTSAKTVKSWTAWADFEQPKRVIKKVDIVSDTVAKVEVEVEYIGYGIFVYTERLTLHKVDGSWKLVTRATVPGTHRYAEDAVR